MLKCLILQSDTHKIILIHSACLQVIHR